MNIQQLRYVVATSELGTMTAAAATLHVAQPALSRSVRALEGELGVRIFEKDGRGVRLTEAGRDVVSVANRILAEVEHLATMGQTTALIVCATKGQARELGVPAVSTLAEQGCQVLLDVVDSRDDVFEAVCTHQAELGLAELPAPAELEVLSLGWQEFVIAHPPDWDLPDPMPVPDLAGVPLLSSPNGDWRREALVAGLKAAGVEPNVAAETTERELVTQLIVGGAGAAFLYGRQAAAASKAGAKVIHLTPPPMREVGVITSSASTGSAVGFIDALRLHAADLLVGNDDPRLDGAARIAGPMVLQRQR